jgi:hypothetical protein
MQSSSRSADEAVLQAREVLYVKSQRHYAMEADELLNDPTLTGFDRRHV